MGLFYAGIVKVTKLLKQSFGVGLRGDDVPEHSASGASRVVISRAI
jgi:hypothetical protein